MLHVTRPLTGAKPRVVAITPDAALADELTVGLGGGRYDLAVHADRVERVDPKLLGKNLSVLVVDLDDGAEGALAALGQHVARAQGAACVVLARSLDEKLTRVLLQAQITDFLVKPVTADRVAEVCTRALQGKASPDDGEAEILTFLPATGGVGNTTLAIHSALLLQEQAGAGSSTCLVDLDFQQGVCAEYLDLEPRLDLTEIEPRPERLDRQLLEVMLSRHASGLSIIAAPGRPGEPVHAEPQTISRLLDLVAANFDNVVIDLPRHWAVWTDGVLLGSNKIFLIAEMTVPALRQARRLATVIQERLAQAPSPRIIVNRFEQRGFGAGLRRTDIEQALGGFFAGTVANNYSLVREAIDQGVPISEIKPRSTVLADLERLVLPEMGERRSRFALPLLGKVLAR